ncbi:MAG: GNAT family N-acetyltransferase [Immundisolibacter sp.]|uniref:GNAT family N-acetyltransferase n=1 Tax=Immundisolibacter sp. TaxID=1934948 RepID=UPI003EE2116D
MTTAPQTRFVDSIKVVSAATWNGLDLAGNPFLRHEFLLALEESGCVDGRSGWTSRHLLIETAGRLLAAAPVYVKQHSYGEYVFDWAWANAYQRAGLRYYPKLVVGVPFTPVTGPRLLLAPGADESALMTTAGEALIAHAQLLQASSVHWLFPSTKQADRLQSGQWLRRSGHQFHWENRGYGSFDDYLAALTAEKRKKVRRERRQVAEAGIRVEVVPGNAAGADAWAAMYGFYRTTVARHGAIPYLTEAFFQRLGETLADCTVLLMAVRDGRYVAGALNLQGADALYGRYWGCHADYHSLHFETCYYRAIEHCIDSGLARFEAGAQGEHKLSRGFLPVETHSLHWLAEPRFADAVADYLAEETGELERYRDLLAEHSPFRRAES